MSSSSGYDEALQALYRAPHESFVAERQRLAAELKGGGDKASAARLAKLARPTISAWAVNQLWWHSRAAFEQLFETANELRAGKLSASGAHRKAVTHLSALAQKLLSESGHAASDATLRRVTMTLSGLAATGSFEPEPAGALTKDRDPPGFDAFGLASADVASEPREATAKAKPKVKTDDRADDTHAEHQRAAAAHATKIETERARAAAARAAAAEHERAAAERAKKEAARRELDAAVRDAKSELGTLQREHERLAKELAASERKVERAQAALEAANARRAELDA